MRMWIQIPVLPLGWVALGESLRLCLSLSPLKSSPRDLGAYSLGEVISRSRSKGMEKVSWGEELIQVGHIHGSHWVQSPGDSLRDSVKCTSKSSWLRMGEGCP